MKQVDCRCCGQATIVSHFHCTAIAEGTIVQAADLTGTCSNVQNWLSDFKQEKSFKHRLSFYAEKNASQVTIRNIDMKNKLMIQHTGFSPATLNHTYC
jgi:hypothetical protein